MSKLKLSSSHQKVISLRKDLTECPENYFVKNVAFVTNYLKNIFESQDTDAKISLLLLLQEHGCSLVQEQCVEEVLEYLRKEQFNAKSNIHLTCNLLLTRTTFVLLESAHKQCTKDEVIDLRENLLAHLTDPKQATFVRSTAGSCLLQMEMQKPGILNTKLDELYKALETETTAIIQILVQICSLINNHKTDQTSGNNYNGASGKITVKMIEFASLLTDVAAILSPVSVASVTDLMIVAPSLISANPFKFLLPSLPYSGDILIQHSFLKIWSEQLGKQDGTNITRSCLSAVCSQSIHPVQRLLLTQICIALAKISPDFVGNSKGHMHNLRPFSTDDPQIQALKMALSSRLISLSGSDDYVIDYLTSNLCYLRQQVVESKENGAGTSMLYKILYEYSLAYVDNGAVTAGIAHFVEGFIQDHPVSCLNALELCQEVSNWQKHEPAVWQHVLRTLVEALTKLKDPDIRNLEAYLKVLEKVSSYVDTTSQPRRIIRYLSFLLDESAQSSKVTKSRSLGQNILSVCCALMKHQSEDDQLHEDTRLVLQRVREKHRTREIQDRAEVLYALLISLSQDKLKQILGTQACSLMSPTSSSYQSESSIASSIPVTPSVTHLGHVVVNLGRITTPIRQECPQTEDLEHINENYYLNLLSNYEKQIQIHPPLLKISLEPSVKSNISERIIYAIEVILDQPEFLEISDPVQIAWLRIEEPNDKIEIEFRAKEAKPCYLGGTVVFSSNGEIFTAPLNRIPLVLSDYFLPLPVPEGLAEKPFRKRIFDLLWVQMEEQAKNRSENSPYIKSIQWASWQVSDRVLSNMDPFICQRNFDTPGNEELNIGILVAPNSHLLYKTKPGNPGTFLELVTDNCNLLPWIEDYIVNLDSDSVKNNN